MVAINDTIVLEDPRGPAGSEYGAMDYWLDLGDENARDAQVIKFPESELFYLVPGEGDHDNPAFTILGNQLQLNVPADFEIKSTYNLRIAGLDVDGERYHSALKVNILDDESDNQPVLTGEGESPPGLEADTREPPPENRAPTDITFSRLKVPDDIKEGSVVSLLEAIDPRDRTHTFKIIEATEPEGLVQLPAGTFEMGKPGQKKGPTGPVHLVQLDSFAIGTHEITLGDWEPVYNWALEHGYDFDYDGNPEGKCKNLLPRRCILLSICPGMTCSSGAMPVLRWRNLNPSTSRTLRRRRSCARDPPRWATGT